MTITNEKLRAAFLPPAMAQYFARKLPHLAPDELEARIEETLKFLMLAPQCTSSIPVTGDIDEIWHYWILQTQQYDALCAAMPAAEFIHHSSHAYIEALGEEPRDDLKSDVTMLAAYVSNYGPFDLSRIKYWKVAANLCERHGWSVEELNGWLAGDGR